MLCMMKQPSNQTQLARFLWRLLSPSVQLPKLTELRHKLKLDTTMKITKTQIELLELARKNGACQAGLKWATAEPRTWAELRKRDIGWYCWALICVAPVEILSQLANDPDAYVRYAVAGNERNWEKIQ